MQFPAYIISKLANNSSAAADLARTIHSPASLIGAVGEVPDVGSLAANINEWLAPNEEIRQLAQGVGRLAEVIFEESESAAQRMLEVDLFIRTSY